MAGDQAPAKDRPANPVITGVVRAVTQPGGKDIDWAKVRAVSGVIAGICVLHGVRHRRWRYLHTFGVVLGVAAAAASLLQRKYAEPPGPDENQ